MINKELVTLKNGSQEFGPFVSATMLSLERLFDRTPIIGHELVMKCRDSNHHLFGDAASLLIARSLVSPDKTIHESIRNIVLSAVTGEDLDMILGSPFTKAS